MEEKPKNRKKGVYLLMALFLAGGGGIFLYFIVQGSADLAGPKNKNFHYGGVGVRKSMAPFFKFLGLTGNEMSKATEARVKNRGFAPDGARLAPADISDWMGKASAGVAPAGSGYSSGSGGSSRGGSGSASAGAPRAVPKMAGKGGGLGIGGGGGSKSSGGTARFSSGGGSGETSVTASASSASGSPSQKGTLGHLRGAQSMLNEGLRSGSAATAKGKWDRSFGVGGGGAHLGGNMAYGKSLVGLDKIKSGEITNLKTTDAKSLSAPPPSAPAFDKEGSALDAKMNSAKEDASKLMKDAASGVTNSALAGATKPGDATPGGGGGQPELPPENVMQTAEARQPEGSYCPDKCFTSDGSTFTDGNPLYEKKGDVWTVTYSGQQTSAPPDKAVTYYQDVVTIDPGTGQMTGMQVFEGTSSDRLLEVN